MNDPSARPKELWQEPLNKRKGGEGPEKEREGEEVGEKRRRKRERGRERFYD